MSRARPVYENTSLMLTRRVRGRCFLLRPSRKTNRIVRYVVAVMAKKWKVHLHAVTVMSNHWHLCVTDPKGNIVNFQRDCHAFIARALNAAHGEFENVWSSSQTSRVECEDGESIVRQIAYTMANPVEAGLVREGRSWPGVRQAWPCKPTSVARPQRFFQGPGWPSVAPLEFERPPGFDELSNDDLTLKIKEAIDAREFSIRTRFGRDNRHFLGRRAVLRQSRHSRPKSTETRFRISPKVACQDKWRRTERLALNKQWSAAYDDSLKAWRTGKPHAVFPFGTYKMRVAFGCRCQEGPT